MGERKLEIHENLNAGELALVEEIRKGTVPSQLENLDFVNGKPGIIGLEALARLGLTGSITVDPRAGQRQTLLKMVVPVTRHMTDRD